jgi:bifunctional pyridoxal-dependent enzyme with beta-cystathionase and maltose regulon repressor activities
MAAHLNTHFQPHTPVQASHIFTASALTAIHEMVAFSLANTGDGVLVSRPVYGRFELDFGNTCGLSIVYADSEGIDPFSLSIVEKYQTAIDEARGRGVSVRFVLIVNPHNPLGKNYIIIGETGLYL